MIVGRARTRIVRKNKMEIEIISHVGNPDKGLIFPNVVQILRKLSTTGIRIDQHAGTVVFSLLSLTHSHIGRIKLFFFIFLGISFTYD
jgi:hypothetical protein